jgi:hypothetical protein
MRLRFSFSSGMDISVTTGVWQFWKAEVLFLIRWYRAWTSQPLRYQYLAVLEHRLALKTHDAEVLILSDMNISASTWQFLDRG